jgi:hypothetical protein
LLQNLRKTKAWDHATPCTIMSPVPCYIHSPLVHVKKGPLVLSPKLPSSPAAHNRGPLFLVHNPRALSLSTLPRQNFSLLKFYSLVHATTADAPSVPSKDYSTALPEQCELFLLSARISISDGSASELAATTSK